MWLPIILICTAPYVQSCNVITGLELLTTKEACFEESQKKAMIAMQSPSIFQAKPACQIIPTKVRGEEKKVDL